MSLDDEFKLTFYLSINHQVLAPCLKFGIIYKNKHYKEDTIMSYGGLTRAEHLNQGGQQDVLHHGTNFYTVFNNLERKRLLQNNAKGLTYKQIHDIFLGTYRGILKREHGKIIRPDYDANASMLVGLYMQGWDFQNLLIYLGRLNINGLTLSKSGSILDAVNFIEVK